MLSQFWYTIYLQIKKKEICNTRISNVTYTSLLPLSQLSVTNSKLVLGPQE